MLVKNVAGKTVDASRFWMEVDRDKSGRVWYYVWCELRRAYCLVEREVLFPFQDLEEAFLVLEELRDGLEAEKAESQPVPAEGCP